MNPLLEQLAAVERLARWPDDAENRRSLRLLEWSQITRQVAAFCLNRRAAARVRQRLPYGRLEAIELQWRLADELRPLGEAGRWPPLLDVSAALTLLERPRPLNLNGQELIHVAEVAQGLDTLRDSLTRARDALPLWGGAAAQLRAFAPLIAACGRVLERDGRLRDSASPLLRRLRSEVVRQEQIVRAETERAMAEARRRGWTTGSEVTLRGDRYCLPVRSGSRGHVQGIVHDRSATGGTLFVEPATVVRLHNEWSQLRLELAAEEARLLRELNRELERDAPDLQDAAGFLLLVDQVRAGLLWSRRYRARRPAFVSGGRLRIVEGRHPLLMQFGPGGTTGRARPRDEPADRTVPADPVRDEGTIAADVVPLDLDLPEHKHVVLVSGPNAGGKSVCLKTVGVLVLMAQCGWDVPARDDTLLPLIGNLYVDLGDEQSIAKSLSSFSAHLGHLAHFLAHADEATLILCDEIGSGTDPQEGMALAFALLDALARKRCTVLASTHYGLLKAAVSDHPAMLNAAMEFDEGTLRPLYRLRMGVPGASHAFAIASRWGMPEPLLARARQMVGEERFRIERLLTELQTRTRRLNETLDAASRRAEAVRQKDSELQSRLAELTRERERLRDRVRQEGEDLLREGRRAIEEAIRRLRSSQAEKTSIRQAKEELQRIHEALPAAAPRPVAVELSAGQRIRIPHLGLEGQVVELRGRKVIADAAGMRLTLDRDSVATAGAEMPREQATSIAERKGEGWRWVAGPPEIRPEIDLRGLRGEEAWQKLDLLIDRAIPAGLKEINVIHGVGTGRLRQTLCDCLGKDPRVQAWREAPLDQGGHGVTIVTLAED